MSNPQQQAYPPKRVAHLKALDRRQGASILRLVRQIETADILPKGNDSGFSFELLI